MSHRAALLTTSLRRLKINWSICHFKGGKKRTSALFNALIRKFCRVLIWTVWEMMRLVSLQVKRISNEIVSEICIQARLRDACVLYFAFWHLVRKLSFTLLTWGVYNKKKSKQFSYRYLRLQFSRISKNSSPAWGKSYHPWPSVQLQTNYLRHCMIL